MNLFFIILFFAIILFSFWKSLVNKKKSQRNKSKLRFKDWMELTNKERQDLDFLDKKETMRKKKALLQSIREEYLRMKNL